MNNTNDNNKLLTKLYSKKQNVSKSKLKKGSNKSHNNLSSSSSTQLQHHQQQQSPSGGPATSPATLSSTMPAALFGKATTTSSSPSVHDTSPLSSKDKTHYKAYTGMNKSSIKCIWEQHDKSDTELHADVYPRLTEDVTYKLWELANNLKTYTRHSGGRLTADLVNEVLKDSNVPPAVGAGNTQWAHVEYDGTYYFHFDEVLELGDEYRKDVTMTQCGALQLCSSWLLPKECAEDLSAFYRALCTAIFVGNDYTFDYAIQTTMVSQYIGCVIKPIIIKCLEMLILEYTDETLDRVIKFLTAAVYNDYARDSSMNDQLFHLSQLFVCLVLGPLDLNTCSAWLDAGNVENGDDDNNDDEKSMKRKARPSTELYSNMSTEMVEKFKMEEEINCISAELQDIKQKPSPIERTLSRPRTIPTSSTTNIYSTLNVDNIRNQDYEDLFQVMENEGFSGSKTELSDEADFKGFKIKQEVLEPMECRTETIKVEVKKEDPTNEYPMDTDPSSDQHINCNGLDSKITFDSSAEYSSISTAMCADRFVDDLCFMIGSAADNWGYLEGEIIFLIAQRLKVFFRTTAEWTEKEYNWLGRVVRLSVALGDYAARELTIYFHEINPEFMPEWLFCHFNQMAVFLRGQSDIFFYEYLCEVCGDGLTPFMIHYSKFLDKLAAKNHSVCATAKKFAIKPKYKIKMQPQCVRQNSATMQKLTDVFPDYHKYAAPHTRKIGFKFAGCCPVILKPKTKLNGVIARDSDTMSLFNSVGKVVVAKRRLMKTITDEKKPHAFYSLKSIQV